MKVDRYTKFVLTVIAVGLWALVINGVIAPQPAVAAAPTEEAQSVTRSFIRQELAKINSTIMLWSGEGCHNLESSIYGHILASEGSIKSTIRRQCGDS